MDIRLIGVVIDSKDNVIGYRLFEVGSKQVRDVPAKALESILASNQSTVVGLKYEEGKICGSNGSIGRYPRVINNSLYGKSPLIIINQIVIDGEVQGYTVVDWKGKMIKVKKSDVIKYSKVQGIANGVLRTREGTQYIASINGEYQKEIVNLPKKKVETPVRVEKKAEVSITTIKEEKKAEPIKKESVKEEKKEFKKPEPVRVNSFEDMVWEMIDFEDYMNMNSLSYDLKTTEENNTEIQFNCSRAERLKYPKGIKTIDYYFSNINLEAQEIVFSPTIRDIRLNIFEMLPNIRSMVFQEGAKQLDVPGCGRLEYTTNETLRRLRFPTTLNLLRFGFNNIDRLESCNLKETSISRMFKCFNNTNFATKLEFPDSLVRLKNTFNDCNGITELKLPDSIEDIQESFVNCGVKKLDLSNCTKLSLLDYKSFMECKRLEEVILPEGLDRLGFNVFKDCNNLKAVNIPSTVTSIVDGAFSSTQIERIVIGNKLMTIGRNTFNNKTVIEFDSTNKSIANGILEYTKFKKIELAEGVEVIGVNSFANMVDLEDIKFPSTLVEIKESAFESLYSLKELDLTPCVNLNNIGKTAFTGSFFKEVVLPEKLERIGDRAFKNCKFVKTVLIPKSVKSIGRGAFAGIGSRESLGTTFYVYSNSFGLTYCKRNKLRHIVINSIDEYYNRDGSNGDNATSIAKLKLVLGGSQEHKQLFREPYVNYADKLYKMYNELKGTYTGNPLGIKLDRSKLIKFPIQKVSLVQEVFDQDSPYKVDVHESNKIYNIDNLAPRFINLSNYITNLFPLNPMPLTTKGMEYIRNNYMLSDIIYRDNYSAIIVFKSGAEKQNTQNYTIVITIGTDIVYVTTFDENSNIKNTFTHNIIQLNKSLKDELPSPISEIISTGTSFNMSLSSAAMIGPLEIPSYIAKQIADRFKKNTLLVASDCSKSMSKSEKKIASLDFESGKIIISNATSYGRSIQSYEQISLVYVLEVKSLNSIESKDRELLLNGIDIESAARRFTYIVDNENFLNKLKQSESAYDTDPIYEWELGQTLGKVKLDKMEEIPVEVYKAIFDTDLYKKSRKKVNSIEKTLTDYNTTILNDYTHIVKEKMAVKIVEDIVPGRDVNYVDFIATSDLKATDVVDCYLSTREFIDNLKKIQSLYIGDTERKIPKLDNELITEDDIRREYIQLDAILVGYRYYFLMLNKYDGGVYYLGKNKDKTGYYKILRFKDLKSACIPLFLSERKDYKGIDETEQVRNIYVCCRDIMAHLESYNEQTGDYEVGYDASYYTRLRHEIMNGLPNGAYVPGIDIGLLELLAKQQ